jgi:hypothetical protein
MARERTGRSALICLSTLLSAPTRYALMSVGGRRAVVARKWSGYVADNRSLFTKLPDVNASAVNYQPVRGIAVIRNMLNLPINARASFGCELSFVGGFEPWRLSYATRFGPSASHSCHLRFTS